MDWKYVSSLSADDLSVEQKDDLYNTIAWLNSDSDDINSKRLKVLFKLSQEILKYKGEQVETLLHELDELATRQGEEEARKMESDDAITTARSSRSRKSSSIEFENLEQKFIELKAKYKKQMNINERNSAELDKVNSKVKNLEMENKQLQNEIQAKSREGSESDVSESVRDQHRELVESIHNKNKQISDLLHDIEEVEKENFLLRDKLTKVRDELSVATKEINKLTEKLNASELKLDENFELVQKLTADNEVIQDDLNEMTKSKQDLEDHFNEFTKEIHTRIDEWKVILIAKDAEIKELKSNNPLLIQQRNNVNSSSSSISSLPNDDCDKICSNALRQALVEREKQLLEVQSHLERATTEMNTNTEILQKMCGDKQKSSEKMKQLQTNYYDIRKQLKIAHERCQDLQDEVVYVEKLVADKDTDLKKILQLIEENSEDKKLSISLKEINDLRSKCRLQEKQIINLVKTSNKLQEASDQFEKENLILRDKFGIPEEEVINLSNLTTKQRKYKKEMEKLLQQLQNEEEQKLQLKSDIQKLNKIVASLSNQIIDLGQKPNRNLAIKTILNKDECLAIIEENEALRKGMHEILNSVNTKKETSLTEIKSETFEKLLRALDVKHISGWYHPAMRLQAELHNLEGVNAELREQLRQTKIKLQDIPSLSLELQPKETVVSEVKQNLAKDETDNQAEIEAKEDINDNLLILQRSIDEKDNENEKLQKIIDKKDKSLKELKENCNVYESKLKMFTENQSEDSQLLKMEEMFSENVFLKRKIGYLESEVEKINALLIKYKTNLTNAAKDEEERNKKIVEENGRLKKQAIILQNLNDNIIDPSIHKQLQKDFENLAIKHREILENIKNRNEANVLEIKLLQESEKMLENEKLELKKHLTNILQKKHENYKEKFNQDIFKELAKKLVDEEQFTEDKILVLQKLFDKNYEKLTKKLAESEVSELTERQRANHTNNLYELVKDQLQKSEEKFKEFSKYNENVLQKNLILQEQINDYQNQLLSYVDTSLYKQLQDNYNSILMEKDVWNKREIEKTKNEDVEKKQSVSFSNEKEQELINLKHQIVDLVAGSDDKLQIALLHSDMLRCKKAEDEINLKLEATLIELNSCRTNLEESNKAFEEELTMLKAKLEANQKQNSVLQSIILKQKEQYLGSIPLCSESIFVNKLMQMNQEKHELFLLLHKTKNTEKEQEILKEQCEIELQCLKKQKQIWSGEKNEFKNILNWMQEKKSLQLNELRFKRQCEFKDIELKHLVQRVQSQADQIAKLEDELILCHSNYNPAGNFKSTETPQIELSELSERSNIVTKSKEVQTTTIVEESLDENSASKIPKQLRVELMEATDKLNKEKELNEQQLKRISELEATLTIVKNQIADKQSQISFYERHILELQHSKKEDVANIAGPGGDNIPTSVDSSNALLQQKLASKEEQILQYQSLLKQDRDNHSLAAERLQEELKSMQSLLAEEKQKHLELQETYNQSRPNLATIEQYIQQVHVLEKHIAELHTNVTLLDAQLQSTREEAGRWRGMANDRLEAMEKLRENLDMQHKSELEVYKNDSDKWREEVSSLKELVCKIRNQNGSFGEDIKKIIKEKERKIQELLMLAKKSKSDKSDSCSNSSEESKLNELEMSKQTLVKENETIKKRFEQLLNRERGAREEIRDLKAQLSKKISSLIPKSDKALKDQYQRKIAQLECEIEELKEKLTQQMAINDTHKIKISEDFSRWKKEKFLQQSIEKLKSKLKEREAECEKLQHTTHSFRLLIERLEREKHNLENRVKTLKRNYTQFSGNMGELENLKMENMQLQSQNELLSSKLEMQQHRAGGLGAAMLQEKLEGQERKIAVLELTSKGSAEVRSELDRLQTANASLQKSNLRFEAENLDLKLDLENINKDVPHLRQQIQHLENYIEVLKKESNDNKTSNNDDRQTVAAVTTNSETKKASELERTVFILKRVVEKLQIENKRLLGGKRPCFDRSSAYEKLKKDYNKLKLQYAELEQTNLPKNLHKTEMQTKRLNAEETEEEIVRLRTQLQHKTDLLDKVKILLHRAATKEKLLMAEIAELKGDEANAEKLSQDSSSAS